MPRTYRLLVVAALAMGLACGVGAWHLSRIAPIGTAYAAKTLCSGVFVSGRDAQSVIDQDIMAEVHPLLHLVVPTVDRARQRTSAHFLRFAVRQAQFRPGLGCVLAIGKPADELARITLQSSGLGPAEALPVGPLDDSTDEARLRAAVDAAFDEPDARGKRRTRAVVILHRGRIVAERYAPGFGPDTPLLGWSMTKTVTGALIGVLVREGRLALGSDRLLPAWRGAGDARAAITLDQLMRMTSGLAFDETYENPLADVARMFFGVGDGAALAAAQPLVASPGSLWHYSSGTSYLLARLLHDWAADEALGFARKALFEPLGMRSAVMEADAADTPVGAAFMYASAHDWARFGQFLLQDGVWHGRRILPEGWVRYMSTLTPQSPRKDFGAHLWLRVPVPFHSAAPVRLPDDATHLSGHEGQFVTVVPSRALVVVRLGLSRPESLWDHETFLVSVLAAFAAPQGDASVASSATSQAPDNALAPPPLD